MGYGNSRDSKAAGCGPGIILGALTVVFLLVVVAGLIGAMR